MGTGSPGGQELQGCAAHAVAAVCQSLHGVWWMDHYCTYIDESRDAVTVQTRSLWCKAVCWATMLHWHSISCCILNIRCVLPNSYFLYSGSFPFLGSRWSWFPWVRKNSLCSLIVPHDHCFAKRSWKEAAHCIVRRGHVSGFTAELPTKSEWQHLWPNLVSG